MSTSKKSPNQDVLLTTAPDQVQNATGTKSVHLQNRLIEQIRDTLWLRSDLDPQRRRDFIQAGFAALEGIKPADEVEGMLAVQMVATHNAAMDCLRRAMLENQTYEGRDQNLKHGAKLLQIYARQLDALNKHRGKGQQKVTVEHVHVAPGGQAIVGNVENPAMAQPPAQDAPKALEHQPAETLNLKPAKRAQRATQSRHER